MGRFSSAALLVVLLAACGDDDNDNPDAGAPAPDATVVDAAPQPSLARGQYLVEHVSACADCHTPRGDGGAPDVTRAFAGVECFIDVNGPEAGGCLHTRNLTNHPTGLMNRSDAEIKVMITEGRRPGGEALVPLMPYWIFHNLDPVDLDSIVLYLRSVPGVDHTVPGNDPPFLPPAAPAPAIDAATVPMPTTVNASTMNGRYLAGLAGACIDCHTPLTDPADFRSLDPSKFFAGGRAFPAALLGVPSPPFPDVIFTVNLTPHATGLAEYTAADIVRVLHDGVAPDGSGICPPMPAGPMAPFGGLTDSDAADIAAYLQALPPVENQVPGTCAAPAAP
jgi:mono/diheme cytochrome c family protein